MIFAQRLAPVVVVFLICVAAFGQSRTFDLSISAGPSVSSISRSEPDLTIVITNRGRDVLDTGRLPFLNVHVSTCFPGEDCPGKPFFHFESIERKRLVENGQQRISLDLAETLWKSGEYDTQERDFLNFSEIPKAAIHLWADIRIPDGFTRDGSGKRVPKYREYRSNVLTLVN